MSHNIGGMAPFVSMPRGRNQMYYPPCPGVDPHPHMPRAPFFPDEKMNCGMGMGEFKPPMVTNPEPPPPKKKRRTSNNNAANLANQQPPPVLQDLLPPPPTGYGDTIVASNPFDDSPPTVQQSSGGSMGHLGGPARHMGCGPPPPQMMMGPSCTMGAGSPMGCGPPISPMGMCGPPQMGQRSPMCGGGPMGMCGGGTGPTPGSPMSHRSPTVGSPLLDCMGHQSRKGSPMMAGPPGGPHSMNCVSPVMGSPLSNNGPHGPMSSPIMPGDMRPINSPMCMNNGGAPTQQNMNNMPQCNMQSDMCKSGGSSANTPSGNSNGPVVNRQQNSMMNHQGPSHGPPPHGPPHVPQPPPNQGHHPHPQQQGMNMHPASMHHPHPMSMQHPPHGYPPPKPMPVSAGKVYPVDQPMVFNPQNPNAPPIYPCGVCHKEVHDNDQAILCESGCNFWFHRVCTGLTEAAYQLLTAEVYAEWVCDKCLTTKNIPLVKFKP
uniref:Putative vesicle coat complex copii subunit sec24/subunit sfb2 n=1 Tax=Triatoma infestans TaxID=30076 RepID=A0A023F2P4_TRIIF